MTKPRLLLQFPGNFLTRSGEHVREAGEETGGRVGGGAENKTPDT